MKGFIFIGDIIQNTEETFGDKAVLVGFYHSCSLDLLKVSLHDGIPYLVLMAAIHGQITQFILYTHVYMFNH